jgi:hypothetical protein
MGPKPFLGPRRRREDLDGIGNRPRIGLVEEHARGTLLDGVQEPTPAERRSGTTERRRLDRGQAEVLVRRGHEPERSAVEPSQFLVLHSAEDGHVGRRAGLQLFGQGAGPDDDQTFVGEQAERVDDLTHVLVRHQPRHAEDETGFDAGRRRPWPVDLDVDRRVHDLGVDPVDVGHPRPHRSGIHQVPVSGCGRSTVPSDERGTQRRQSGAGQSGRTHQILIGLIEPTCRIVAIDDLGAGHVCAVRPAARRTYGDLRVHVQV